MLKLLKIKEYKDGSADYHFDYDQKFIDYYKKETGETVIDDKKVGQFILAKLKMALDDGKQPVKRTRKRKKL